MLNAQANTAALVTGGDPKPSGHRRSVGSSSSQHADNAPVSTRGSGRPQPSSTNASPSASKPATSPSADNAQGPKGQESTSNPKGDVQLAGKALHTGGKFAELSEKATEALEKLGSLGEKVPALKELSTAMGGFQNVIGDICSALGGDTSELVGRVSEILAKVTKPAAEVAEVGAKILGKGGLVKAGGEAIAKNIPLIGTIAGGISVGFDLWDQHEANEQHDDTKSLCATVSAVMDATATVFGLLDDTPCAPAGVALCSAFSLAASVVSHFAK